MESEKFDEEVAPIEIPGEIIDDIDNDYDIKEPDEDDEEEEVA